MKKKSLMLIFTILAAVSIILSACGTDNGSSSDAKKFIGGTEASFAPFIYLDEKGTVSGIDPDIVKAIAEEMGFEYELQNVGWEPVFAKLTNGEIDFGAAGITITEKRKETYDFTEPYYEATLFLIVPKDNTDIKSVADLKDKKVAVQINTTSHEAAKKVLGETNSNIMAYENQPLAYQEVINGTAAAAIGDNAVIIEYLRNNPDAPLKTIEDPSFEKEYYGLMVKKGNTEMLNLLNEGLKKIKENGKLAEITGQETDF
ncbi:basic amino acid ABC transporter substrate-binding protein [Ureibacillus manganicus]|uniref:Amino acid ABC transporter substrate-binding protein n=1 Tax=Ureibacillus manganicus DSM 26584 TaxID=1384049 RepID=A0A0A3I5E8_9BACL|nr:basic amino acid ABC transporter substrate-binding protein [Ureibacillus manganicus]KGR80026.1 amino acid ABC transporter substrate-binding protein [Ureibacillus manganicus DSM 26584]